MNRNGLTLAELLIILLVICVITALVLPWYLRVTERARMAEAVQLMEAATEAENRRLVNTDGYTSVWTALDTAPYNAAALDTYCTKGAQEALPGDWADSSDGCAGGNGFALVLQRLGTNRAKRDAVTAAYRVNGNEFRYYLTRPYLGVMTSCVPVSPRARALCNEFHGVDTDAAREALPGYSTKEPRFLPPDEEPEPEEI